MNTPNPNPAQGDLGPTGSAEACAKTEDRTVEGTETGNVEASVTVELSEEELAPSHRTEKGKELTPEQKADNAGIESDKFVPIFLDDVTPSLYQYSGSQDVINAGFFNSYSATLKLHDNIMVTREIRGNPQVSWLTVTKVEKDVVEIRLAGDMVF